MTESDIVRVQDPLQGIGFVQDEKDVLDALARLNIVKEALKQADRFRSESVKFARYEAGDGQSAWWNAHKETRDTR